MGRSACLRLAAALTAARGQRGSLLAEVVVVVGVFTILGTGVLSSLQTGHIAKGQFEIQATSENLVRNQLAYIQEQAYASPGADYLDIAAPTGFSIDTQVLPFSGTSSSDLSRVLITISQGTTTVRTFETVRASE